MCVSLREREIVWKRVCVHVLVCWVCPSNTVFFLPLSLSFTHTHTLTHTHTANRFNFSTTKCILEKLTLIDGSHQVCCSVLSVLQRVAACCSVLQCFEVRCSALKSWLWSTARIKYAPRLATPRHTETPCNTLQHTATHYNTLQHTTTLCNIMQHTATHCNKTFRLSYSYKRPGGLKWKLPIQMWGFRDENALFRGSWAPYWY